METLQNEIGETDVLENEFLDIFDYLEDRLPKLEELAEDGKGDVAFHGFDHRLTDGVSAGYRGPDCKAIGMEKNQRAVIFTLDNGSSTNRLRLWIYDVVHDTRQSAVYGTKKQYILQKVREPTAEEVDWLAAVLTVERYDEVV